MPSRFEQGELAWLPAASRKDSLARLASGRPVRVNISDPSLNQRLSTRNATVIHWIGAIRIPGATTASLRGLRALGPVLSPHRHCLPGDSAAHRCSPL